MCFLWKGRSKYGINKVSDELTTDELKKIIDDFAAIGTAGIGFTGGEPLIRPDMLDIIRYTKKKGLVTHMSSNGVITANKEICKAVIASGLDAIGFSLDGLDAKTHDKIRGVSGTYDKVIQSIKNFVELRKEMKKDIKIIALCVISKYNVDQLLDLIKMLKNLGVDHISFAPFHDMGRLSLTVENTPDFKIEDKDLKKLNNVIDNIIKIKKTNNVLIENSYEYLGLFKNCFAGEKFPGVCHAGYATLCIGPRGDIYSCFPHVQTEVGKGPNIRNISIKDFWKSNEAKKMREDIKNCHECFWNNQAEINLLLNKLFI
jgi:MoaA/NifB/PqqE/SkfB family radical SAM enzyme